MILKMSVDAVTNLIISIQKNKASFGGLTCFPISFFLSGALIIRINSLLIIMSLELCYIRYKKLLFNIFL